MDDLAELGSSPRTWGTADPLLPKCRPYRFIPTYVGNSGRARTLDRPRAVHPHVRGEQFEPGVLEIRRPGSSPRTWGTAVTAQQPAAPRRFIPTYVGNRTLSFFSAVQDQRFIPTYVGNRLLPCWIRARMTVHPHVRGEQPPRSVLGSVEAGSSPRTWGTVTPK